MQVLLISNVVASHKNFHQKEVKRSLVRPVDGYKQFDFLPSARVTKFFPSFPSLAYTTPQKSCKHSPFRSHSRN